MPQHCLHFNLPSGDNICTFLRGFYKCSVLAPSILAAPPPSPLSRDARRLHKLFSCPLPPCHFCWMLRSLINAHDRPPPPSPTQPLPASGGRREDERRSPTEASLSRTNGSRGNGANILFIPRCAATVERAPEDCQPPVHHHALPQVLTYCDLLRFSLLALTNGLLLCTG